jgi:hypothetical protein
MALSRADWISVAVTLILAGAGYYFGGAEVAIMCIVLGVLILLGSHFLAGKSKADIFLYIVAALLFLPSTIVSITGHPVFYKEITPDNVEAQLKKWSGEFGFQWTNLPIPENFSIFSLEVTLPNGTKIVTGRPKNETFAVDIATFLIPPPDQVQALDAMQPSDANVLLHNLRIDVEREQMAWIGITRPLRIISIAKEVPLSSLT